jgi:hypothetical protein
VVEGKVEIFSLTAIEGFEVLTSSSKHLFSAFATGILSPSSHSSSARMLFEGWLAIFHDKSLKASRENAKVYSMAALFSVFLIALETEDPDVNKSGEVSDVSTTAKGGNSNISSANL